MQVKHDYMWMEFENLDPRAQQVARMMDAFSRLCFGREIMITSIFRPDKNSKHSKYEAFDIRTKWYDEKGTVRLEEWLIWLRDWLRDKDNHKWLAVEPHEDWKDPEHEKYDERHLHIHIKEA